MVLGVAGGVVYALARPAMAASSPSAPSPAQVAQSPSATLTNGTWILIAQVAGYNLDGSLAAGGAPMAESQMLAFFSAGAYSNPTMLWWGPTGTRNDPAGFLGLTRIGAGTFAGAYIVLVSFNGPDYALPAGVTAYKVG